MKLLTIILASAFSFFTFIDGEPFVEKEVKVKPTKPRVSVTFMSSDNHAMANARTAVVGHQYRLNINFFGTYPDDRPLAVLILVNDELVGATDFRPGSTLQFQYTFSRSDYLEIRPRESGFTYDAEDRTTESFLDRQPEATFEFRVVEIKFDRDTGSPTPGKIIVSLSYKIRLNCMDCSV